MPLATAFKTWEERYHEAQTARPRFPHESTAPNAVHGAYYTHDGFRLCVRFTDADTRDRVAAIYGLVVDLPSPRDLQAYDAMRYQGD